MFDPIPDSTCCSEFLEDAEAERVRLLRSAYLWCCALAVPAVWLIVEGLRYA